MKRVNDEEFVSRTASPKYERSECALWAELEYDTKFLLGPNLHKKSRVLNNFAGSDRWLDVTYICRLTLVTLNTCYSWIAPTGSMSFVSTSNQTDRRRFIGATSCVFICSKSPLPLKKVQVFTSTLMRIRSYGLFVLALNVGLYPKKSSSAGFAPTCNSNWQHSIS